MSEDTGSKQGGQRPEDGAGGENMSNGQHKSEGVDPTRPVGPGNPPAHGTWQKGQSGNPAGKPPGTRSAKVIVNEWMDRLKKLDGKQKAAIKGMMGIDAEELTMRELLLLSQFNRAISKGSVESFSALMKLAGEFEEQVVLSGSVAGGAPFVLELVGVKPKAGAADKENTAKSKAGPEKDGGGEVKNPKA